MTERRNPVAERMARLTDPQTQREIAEAGEALHRAMTETMRGLQGSFERIGATIHRATQQIERSHELMATATGDTPREAAPAGVVADPMDEDEWIVRGTRDPVLALAAVVGEDGDDRDKVWLPGLPRRTTDPAVIEEVAAWCYTMLGRARPGLWRKVPCGHGSYGHHMGWAWQLVRAKDGTRAPGVFAGVYFIQP